MTAAPLPDTTVTRPPRRRVGPRRMIGALAATVIAAGAIAFAASRDDATPPRLALATTGGGAEPSASIAMAPTVGDVTYVIDGTLPTLPDRAPVWKVVPTSVDRDRVADWARLLEVTGDVRESGAPDEPGGNGWEVADSDAVLSVGTSSFGSWVSMSSGIGIGGAIASDSGSAGAGFGPTTTGPITTDGVPSTVAPVPVEPNPPAALPTAAEAESIARSLLDRMGVLEGDWSFSVNDGGQVGTAIACAAGVECTAPIPIGVVLTRSVTVQAVVDDMPVSGLSWSVEIGDHGAVTNLNGQLASLERIGEYPLRTPTAALVDFETDGAGPVPMGVPESVVAIGDCASDSALCAGPECPELCADQPRVQQLPITVRITDVSLSAQVWSGSDPTSPTQYVVPMYHFTGHTDTADWPVDVLALGDAALVDPTPMPDRPTDSTSSVPSTLPVHPTPGDGPAFKDLTVGSSIPMTFDLNSHTPT